MDRALTKAIHAIADSIPEGSKEYNVTVSGIVK